MKNRIKKYYMVIILVFFVGCIFSFKTIFSKNYDKIDGIVENCNRYLKLDDIDRKEYDEENPGSYTIQECEYIIDKNNKPISFFLLYQNVFNNGIVGFIFPLLVPVILMYPIIYGLLAEYENGFIKYYLQRKKYSKYVIHLFRDSYKYIFIIAIMLLMLFLGSVFLSSFRFNPTMDIYLLYISDGALLFYNNFGNCIIYIIVILLNLLTYINLILLTLRFCKRNFLITFVESFLVIYLYWCFTFIIVGNLLNKYFGIWPEHVNLLEIYTWNQIVNPRLFLVFNIICYLCTLVLVLLSYKNKEKFILRCEER